jgi:hypothetical protein
MQEAHAGLPQVFPTGMPPESAITFVLRTSLQLLTPLDTLDIDTKFLIIAFLRKSENQEINIHPKKTLCPCRFQVVKDARHNQHCLYSSDQPRRGRT